MILFNLLWNGCWMILKETMFLINVRVRVFYYLAQECFNTTQTSNYKQQIKLRNLWWSSIFLYIWIAFLFFSIIDKPFVLHFFLNYWSIICSPFFFSIIDKPFVLQFFLFMLFYEFFFVSSLCFFHFNRWFHTNWSSIIWQINQRIKRILY
jgi:hypothetical protein